MNDAIRGVAAKTGAALFDFARSFPDDSAYFVDGEHVNDRGSALKAEQFAGFLAESGLLPPPTATAPSGSSAPPPHAAVLSAKP